MLRNGNRLGWGLAAVLAALVAMTPAALGGIFLPPPLDGTNGDDTITITVTGTDALSVVINGGAPVVYSGVNALLINGLDGNDTLIIDLTASVFAGTITFDGGAGNDMLKVIANNTQAANYTPDVAVTGNGAITVNGQTTVNFVGLEPVDITGAGVVNVNFAGANDVFTIANGFDSATGLIPALVVSGTSGGVGFEAPHLWNNGTVVIDTTTAAGVDTVTVTSANNAHLNTNLTILTGIEAGDVVNLNGDITVSGALTITTPQVTLNPAASVTLTHTGALSLAISGGALDTNGKTLIDNATTAATTGGIASQITGTGAVTKNGPGLFALTGLQPNTFSGTTTLNDGKLILSKNLPGGGMDAIGGNLVISTPSASWANSGNGVELAANEQIPDTAVITFSGAAPGDYCGFRTKGFTETVAGISCANGSGVIENGGEGQGVNTNGALKVGNNATSYSFTGFLRDADALGGGTGTLSVEKLGMATQTLAGGFIRYTGATTITNGTLVLSDTTSFNNGASDVALANNSPAAIGLELNSTIAAPGWLLRAVVSGTGTVTKTGTGAVTVAGTLANTFSGVTTLNDGKLILGKSASTDAIGSAFLDINTNANWPNTGVELAAPEQIPDAAVISFTNGLGGFRTMGFSETVGGVSCATGNGVIENSSVGVPGNGTLTINNSVAYSFTGYMRDFDTSGGTLSLVKLGAATQTFVGGNIAYTGTTTISGGTLALSDTSSFNSDVTDNATLELNSTVSWTLSKAVTGTGGVTKTGAGIVALAVANGYDGATNIQTGTLRVGNIGAIPSGAGRGDVTVDGVLDLNGNSIGVNGLLGAGTVDNVAAGGNITLTVGNNNANGNFAGVIQNSSGTLALTKTGSGTQTLSGALANTFGGVTTLDDGKLVLGKAGSTNAVGGNVNVNTPSANWPNTGVELAAAEQIPDAAVISFTNGLGGFRTMGFSETVGGVSCATGNGVIENSSVGVPGNGTLAINNSVAYSFTGYMRDFDTSGGTLSLVKLGAATQTFVGPNINYTGATTITAGTLTLSNTSSFNSAVTNNSATVPGLELNSTIAAPGWTLAAAVGGTGAMTKTGAGQVVLTAASGYSGATLISAGTLQVTGPGSIANSAVTIDSTGTLSGTGTTGGIAVTTGQSGTLSPGSPAGNPGTLNCAGVSFGNNTAAFNVQLNGAGAGTYDQLNVTAGTVNLNQSGGALGCVLTLSIGGGYVPTPGVDQLTIVSNGTGSAVSGLFTYAGAALPEGAQFTVGGYAFTITYQGGASTRDVVLNSVQGGFTWIGNGADDNWTTGANWVGGFAPVAGANLVFGDLAAVRKTTNINDFAANTTFGSILFNDGGYTLGAAGSQPLQLSGGAAALNNNVAGANTISANLGITFVTAAPTISVAPSGTLTVTGTIDMGNMLLTVGTGAGANANLDGVISSTGGGLDKVGAGTLTLAAANSYTGATTVTDGTLLVAANAPSGANGALGNSAGAVAVGGALNAALLTNGAFTIGRPVTVAAGAGTTTLGGNSAAASSVFSGVVTLNKSVTLTQAGAGTVAFTGLVADGGGGFGVTKTGTGTVVLSNANTYAGTTTLVAGTLAFGNDSAIGTGGLTIDGGTTIRSDTAAHAIANAVTVAGNFTVGGALDLNLSGAMGLGGVTRTVTVSNTGTTTFSGIIANGGLTKAGAGTLVLSNGANSYAGGTTVNGGTLQCGANNVLGTGFAMVDGGATLNLGANAETVGAVTLVNGTISNGTLTGTGYDVQNGTVSAVLAGAGVSLTKSTGGTVTLSANNTYGGTTTVAAGTLADGIDNALPPATTGLIVTGGSFDLNGRNQTVASVTGTGTVTNGGASATFTVNNTAPDTFDGVLTGGANLNVTADGTADLLLTATSAAYSGTTIVRTGATLVMTVPAGSISGSTVQVDAGGTLRGTGTVGQINCSGTVWPGTGTAAAGVGTLFCSGATFAAGSTLQVRIPDAGTSPTDTARATVDRLNVSGDLSIDSSAHLKVDLTGAPASCSNTQVAVAGGTVTGTFAFDGTGPVHDTVYALPADAAVIIPPTNTNTTGKNLTAEYLPEPGTKKEVIVHVNTTPTITSLAATPDPAGFDQPPVTFSLVVNDPDGNLLTYTWNFGEAPKLPPAAPTVITDQSSSGGSANTSHIYSSSLSQHYDFDLTTGNATVTVDVTVTDGYGGKTTQTVKLTIFSPLGGLGVGDDYKPTNLQNGYAITTAGTKNVVQVNVERVVNMGDPNSPQPMDPTNPLKTVRVSDAVIVITGPDGAIGTGPVPAIALGQAVVALELPGIYLVTAKEGPLPDQTKSKLEQLQELATHKTLARKMISMDIYQLASIERTQKAVDVNDSFITGKFAFSPTTTDVVTLTGRFALARQYKEPKGFPSTVPPGTLLNMFDKTTMKLAVGIGNVISSNGNLVLKGKPDKGLTATGKFEHVYGAESVFTSQGAPAAGAISSIKFKFIPTKPVVTVDPKSGALVATMGQAILSVQLRLKDLSAAGFDTEGLVKDAPLGQVGAEKRKIYDPNFRTYTQAGASTHFPGLVVSQTVAPVYGTINKAIGAGVSIMPQTALAKFFVREYSDLGIVTSAGPDLYSAADLKEQFLITDKYAAFYTKSGKEYALSLIGTPVMYKGFDPISGVESDKAPPQGRPWGIRELQPNELQPVGIQVNMVIDDRVSFASLIPAGYIIRGAGGQIVGHKTTRTGGK